MAAGTRFNRENWSPSEAASERHTFLSRLELLPDGKRMSCCCRPDIEQPWSQTGRLHGSVHRFGQQFIFDWQNGDSESFPLDGIAWGTQCLVYTQDLNPIKDEQFVPHSREGKVAFVSELASKVKDGKILRCRGRDSQMEPWDYGWCKKKGNQMLFFYVNGDCETNRVGWFAWGSLLQVLSEDLNYTPKVALQADQYYGSHCMTQTTTQRTFSRMWYFNDKWKSLASVSMLLPEQSYQAILDQGCVGMTRLIVADKSQAPIKAGYTPLKGFKEFEVARSVWLSQAHPGCCLFAICFWSNPGERAPDDAAFLPDADGMIDLTGWSNSRGHKGRKRADGMGKHINFDYGWYEPGSGIWHANHSHTGTADPMVCYQSTVDQFHEELSEPLETREFDRCVWFISESRFGLARAQGERHCNGRERGTSGPWGNVGAYNPRKSSTNPPVFVPNPFVMREFRKFCTPWMTDAQGVAKCPKTPAAVPVAGEIQKVGA